jgi:hypothetical protein
MFAFSRRTRFAISFGAFKIGEVKKDLLNDVSGFISQLQVLYRTNKGLRWGGGGVNPHQW